MDKIKASTMTAQYCAILAGHLPSEYQQVEYLQSASGQYIKTGFVPSQRFKTVVDGVITSDGILLGSFNGIWGPSSILAQVSYGISKAGVFRFFNPRQDFSTYDAVTIRSRDTNRHIFVEDWLTPQYKVDESVGTPNDYFPTFNSFEFFLFGRNQSGNLLNSGTMKAYSVQIYNSAGKLVLNYVPCYRKIDRKPGMYDLVSRTFVTNSGSGDFTVGGNV